MKQNRHSESRIMEILKEAESGIPLLFLQQHPYFYTKNYACKACLKFSQTSNENFYFFWIALEKNIHRQYLKDVSDRYNLFDYRF